MAANGVLYSHIHLKQMKSQLHVGKKWFISTTYPIAEYKCKIVVFMTQ